MQSKFNLLNDTRRVTFTASAFDDIDMVPLVVVVTAIETITDDLLEVNDTSDEFWYNLKGDEPGPGPDPDEPEVEREYSIPWLVIAVIVILIVIVVVVVLLLAINQGSSPQTYLPSQGAPSLGGTVCPQCSGPTSTVNAFGQSYCEECDRFV